MDKLHDFSQQKFLLIQGIGHDMFSSANYPLAIYEIED